MEEMQAETVKRLCKATLRGEFVLCSEETELFAAFRVFVRRISRCGL